jgi:hypothetical protein
MERSDLRARVPAAGAPSPRLPLFDPDASLVWMIAALLPLMVLLLFPRGITPNEEEYFGLAHAFVAPHDYPAYTAFFNVPRYLFLWCLLAGELIVRIGFERAWLVLRLAQVVLYIGSLAVLFRSLRISPLGALLVLSFYVTLERQMVGQEWLFHGVEGKTLAYTCVFFAVAAMIHDRPRWAAGLLLLGTYFHFLVGGFWFLAIVALHYLLHRKGRRTALLAAIYAVGIAPLVALLVIDLLPTMQMASPDGGPSADYIYTFLSNPFHVAPFEDFPRWLPRIVVFSLLFLAAGWSARRRGTPTGRVLGLFLVAMTAYLLVALGISWLDRHTGWWGKFYLFRPMAFTALLALCAFALPGAVQPMPRPDWKRMLRLTAAVVLIGWFVEHAIMRHFVPHGPPQVSTAAAVEEVHRLTRPGDLVLVELVPNDHVELARKLERPTLVNNDLIPADPAGIYRWYHYMEWERHLFTHGCPPRFTWEVPARYILLLTKETQPVMASCGDTIWSDGDQALLRVK